MFANKFDYDFKEWIGKQMKGEFELKETKNSLDLNVKPIQLLLDDKRKNFFIIVDNKIRKYEDV